MSGEELAGCFVCTSAEEVNAFPGALHFRPRSATSTVLVIALHEQSQLHRNGYEQYAVLKGAFLSSTLRGLKVFEATELSLQATELSGAQEVGQLPVPPLPNTRIISGKIERVSQCLSLKSGPTVFVTFQSPIAGNDEVPQCCLVLLMGAAVQCLPYLREGDQMELNNPQRFRWKNIASTQEVDSTGDYWASQQLSTGTAGAAVTSYFVEQPSQITTSAPVTKDNDIATECSTSTSESQESDSDEDSNSDTAAVAALTAEDLITPATLLDKEALAGTEFAALTGTVNLVHPMGWVELRDATLYMTWSSSSDCCGDDKRDEQDMTVPLPYCLLYLSHHCVQHLRLTALGVSVRQGASIRVSNILPVYLWGRMKGLATTCRSNIHITAFARNRQFASKDPTYCAVSVKVPAEIRNACIIYSAWRVEIARRLAQAGGCSAGLEGSITTLLEGLAEFAEDRGDAGRVALFMREVVELPPIPIQSELFDLNTVLLYTMRNGHDADWLGNNLPQLYTVSHFVSKVKMLHGSKNSGNASMSAQGGDEHQFALFWYDLCAVARNQSYWAQYSRGGGGSGSARKNVALVGVVQYISVQRREHRSSGKVDMCISLKLRDAQGCVVSAVVHEDETGLRERLLAAAAPSAMKLVTSTEEVCPRCAGREVANKQVSSAGSKLMPARANNVRAEYCMPCTCGVIGGSSASARARDDDLVVVLHRPFALVERVSRSVGASTELRFIATCSARDVSIVKGPADAGDGSQSAAQTAQSDSTSSNSGSSLSALETPCTGIRQLLSADLLGARQKHIPGVVAIVTHIQVLVVEFKQDAGRDSEGAPSKGLPSLSGATNASAGSRKRPLESQYSLYENAGDSSNTNNTGGMYAHSHTGANTAPIAVPIAPAADRKCSVVLRDLSYPDHINIYLPLAILQGVMVGAIVEIRDLFVCLPESQKKLYLKPVDAAKCTVDFVGMAQGWQLQRLCALSVTAPDPRSLDAPSIRWSEHDSISAGTSSAAGAASLGGVLPEPFLRCPTRTSFRWLTQVSAYQRALWTVQCQVVFIRKINVTLRCSKCHAFAKIFQKQGGYQCSKCLSSHTLRPLWEAQVALDDGTGESNAHIEGDCVFAFIRARFDEKGLVLQEVRALVDQYVRQFGSLAFDAFDRPGFCEYNKPYSLVVEEQQQQLALGKQNAAAQSDKSSATTVAEVPLLERFGSNAVFDMPVTEKEKVLTPRFDLRDRPASVKVGTVLKAYMQVGSCAQQFSVVCRVDFSATALKQGNTKSAKRELKLQRSNAEKPYLAYFAMFPTSAGAKLCVQVLHAREVHGGELTTAAWDLLQRLRSKSTAR